MAWGVVRTALTGLAALPIERMIVSSPSRNTARERINAPLGNPAPAIERPGCVAADETLVVKGHLEGLSNGLGGFGVLRTSKDRLDKAAQAARVAQAPAIALEIELVAERLPDVRTPDEAAALARELDPIVPQVWELGQRCGKALSPETLSRAGDLAKEIAEGRMSKEDAIGILLQQETSNTES